MSDAVVWRVFNPFRQNIINQDASHFRKLVLIRNNGTTYSDSTSGNFSDPALVSTTLSIVLLDDQGESIKELDTPLTICLAPSINVKKNQEFCLSFYDEDSDQWRCEDKYLTKLSKGGLAQDTRNLLCGKSGHLTDFALLLTGKRQLSSNDSTLSCLVPARLWRVW